MEKNLLKPVEDFIIVRVFHRSMPRGHGTLERKSTQSALSIRQWAFSTSPRTSKKQRHFVLCSNTPKSFESVLLNTKPLRLRFGSAICSDLQLFF